jgi:hypothetical protein
MSVIALVQRRSLLGGYPGHDALHPSFYDFLKNPDNRVETDRTSERFFDGNPISRKVKTTACVGRGAAVRSKAPSAYASAATAQRLANTLRVPRSSYNLF